MPLPIGGQAVIEGVMLRSPNAIAVSVRRPDGSIKLKSELVKPLSRRFRIFKYPVFRGVATLWDSLFWGLKSLNYSAREALAGQGGQRMSRRRMGVSLGLSIAAAIAIGGLLFMVLPLAFSELLAGWVPVVTKSGWLFNLIDGLFRIFIFTCYIFAISLFPDIRRVFEYHGAEHRVVHAYEAGGEVNVQSARKFEIIHRRCGTSFLLILLILVILLFSLIPYRPTLAHKLTMRLIFLPVVLAIASGVSYEIIKLSARSAGSRLARALTAPGLLLQRLVTRQPSDDQVQVAIAALNGVLNLERGLSRGAAEEVIG